MADAWRRVANVSAAQRHFQRCQATPGCWLSAPYKREAGGSKPSAPTKFVQPDALLRSDPLAVSRWAANAPISPGTHTAGKPVCDPPSDRGIWPPTQGLCSSNRQTRKIWCQKFVRTHEQETETEDNVAPSASFSKLAAEWPLHTYRRGMRTAG